MTRSATFVIALWAFMFGTELGRMTGTPHSVWWLVLTFIGLGISVILAVAESRKSGRSA